MQSSKRSSKKHQSPKQKLVVIIPTIPKYQSHEQHYGAEGDEGKRVMGNMVETDKDVLNHGKNVLKSLLGKKIDKDFDIHPQVVYLGAIGNEEKNHRLQDAIGGNIAGINFIIVAHGNPRHIGTAGFHDEITPELLSELFNAYFEMSSEEINFLQMPLGFEFQTCNSAYFSIKPSHEENMKEALRSRDSASLQDVTKDFKKASYVGRFYDQMKEIGYENIAVVGYRGYVGERSDKKGLSVSPERNNLDKVIGGSAVRYSIDKDGGVTFPAQWHCKVIIEDEKVFYPPNYFGIPSPSPKAIAQEALAGIDLENPPIAR